MDLDFLYDIACPYAWMASVAVEALAAETGAALRWRPMLLGGLFKQLGAPSVPAASWSPQRAAHGARDLVRQADRLGLKLRQPATPPARTVEAMRLLIGASEAARPGLSHALFTACWVEGRDVADRAFLGDLARAHGQDPAVIDAPETRDALYAATAWAAAQGAFGAPSFLVNGRLFWGQDRMHLVRAALGGPDRAPARSPRPLADPPRRLRLFHDTASPFSYLGFSQAAAVAAAHGARLELTPILLGALFREIGTPDVPLFAMSQEKQLYYGRDLYDQAGWLGQPFSFPSCFPVRSVLAQRVSLVAPEATGPLYRALWVEDRDIGRAEVVGEVLSALGLDAPAVLAEAESPAIKAQLRDNTAEAARLGACGVPTFQVDGGPLFWGVDRLDLVERALEGWRAPCDR